MPESVAAKRKVGQVEIPEEFLRRAPQLQTAKAMSGIATSTTNVATPTDNPIYKIIFSLEFSPEQKQTELAKFLAATDSKEACKAAIQAYQEFEAFLQAERERMSKEIVRLTDTETFSELQSTYDQLGRDLLDFDEKMKPLTDILDALYELRSKNKTFTVFAEIQEDKKTEAERKRIEQEKDDQFQQIQARILHLQSSTHDLQERKAFFGYGHITPAARAQIAQNEADLTAAQNDLDQLQKEIVALNESASDQSGEFSAQKAKLRELLDIASDTHRQRQKDLVATTLNFIETAKTRIGSVRDHLGQMTNQIDSLYEGNGKITRVYAMMNEGVKDAIADSKTTESGLDISTSESLLAKMEREEKLAIVQDHLQELNGIASSTLESFSDLTSDAIRINTMRKTNAEQMDIARRMHGQGVAGVAGRLSTVITAVSAAALGESSAMAKMTLSGMVDRTNLITQKEVIRTAMGVQEVNRDLEKAIADLGDFGEVFRTSTGIYKQGMEDVHASMAKMRSLAQEVQKDIQVDRAVHAEVEDRDTSDQATPQNQPTSNGQLKGPQSPLGF